MKKIFKLNLIGFTVIAAATAAPVAISQQSSGLLEEVIVTSKKRAQSLQDVSLSVNVLGGEKIAEAGITKIEDLQAYVPNLTMSETGIGTNIYIRGIGSGINQGFEQSVGMYKDGVSHGRAQLSRAPFLDLERVEVLRGPQNILYGRNSIAGALSITTAQPTEEFEGHVALTYESDYGEQIADVVLSGPLAENLTGRFAHRTRKMDGYVADLDGGDEPDRDEQTTRLSLRWDISDDLDATLIYEDGSFDVTGRQVEIIGDQPSLNPALSGANWSQFLFSLNPLNAFTGADLTPASALNVTQDFQRSANRDFSDNNTETITLTVNYALGDLSLTSVTSSLEYDYREICDCDFTSANIFFVESTEDYSQFSQEFRLASPVGEKFEWIAGIYYQSSDLEFTDRFFTDQTSSVGNLLDTILPGLFTGIYPAGAAQQLNGFAAPRTFDQDSDLWSGFVQATWNINDVSRLTLGGRYSSEEKSASRTLTYTDLAGNELAYNDSFVPNTFIGVDYILGRVLNVARHDLAGNREESKFAPSATYEYDLNDSSLGYISWARGFKAGGYDVRSNVSSTGYSVINPFASALSFELEPGSFEYSQERAETIEIGLKTTLLDGNMELNIAAFNTDYEDLQVSIFDGSLGFNVGNAGEATTKGIEMDGRWALSESFWLAASLAWLDFEFTDFPNGQCTQIERITTGENLCDYQGLSNQYVADLSGYLSANYETAITDSLLFRATADLLYTSDYNPTQNLDPNVEEDGYTKLNLRLAISDIDDQWEVALIGKNLTDENIVTYANDTPLATSLSQSIGYYGFVESPRTLSVQGTYRF